MEKIVHEALKSNPNGYVTKGVYMCVCGCVYYSVYMYIVYVCVHMCTSCVRVSCNISMMHSKCATSLHVRMYTKFTEKLHLKWFLA